MPRTCTAIHHLLRPALLCTANPWPQACTACGPASFSAQVAAALLARPAAARAPSCSELADELWWLDEGIPLGLAPSAALMQGWVGCAAPGPFPTIAVSAFEAFRAPALRRMRCSVDPLAHAS